MEQIPIGERPTADQVGNVVELPTAPFSSPPHERTRDEEPTGAQEAEPPPQPPAPDPGAREVVVGGRTDVDDLVEQGMRVVIGMASVAAGAVSRALERTMPVEPDDQRPVAGAALAGATLGLAMETGRLAVHGISTLAASFAPLLSFATSAPSLRERTTPIAKGIDRFNEVWSEARPQHEAAAAAFVADLVPRIVDGVVEQLDLTALVADRIDLDAIVDRIDLDAVVDRIDVDEIVRRVDLEVAVGRIDLLGITDRLIGEVDLPELIRESTGAVTSETVRNVRMLSAEVDRRLAYVVDRVLMRRRERATGVGSPADAADTDGSGHADVAGDPTPAEDRSA